MRVFKWWSGLVVRLPTAFVDALNLHEGDEIETRLSSDRLYEVGQNQARERAVENIRSLRRAPPQGWRFDREEANAR